MKTLVFILTFLVVCSSAMSAVNFTVTGSGDGSGLLTISYTTTDGDLPRGIALTVSCTNGFTCDPATGVVLVDPWYNTYIDWAYSNLSGYEIGDGHPLAELAGAGVLAAPASDFSICMGVLDQDANQAPGPAMADPLVVLELTWGIGDMSVVTIDVDTFRGGVAGEDGPLAVTGLPAEVTIGSTSCMAGTNADFARWDSLGRPCCWCCQYQCHGDANCDSQFGGLVPVYESDLAIFVASYGQTTLPEGGICADFDHIAAFGGLVAVYTEDLALLVANYGQTEVFPCSGPGAPAPHDTDPLPNSEFNFWMDDLCEVPIPPL